jgi:hypothetical protein
MQLQDTVLQTQVPAKTLAPTLRAGTAVFDIQAHLLIQLSSMLHGGIQQPQHTSLHMQVPAATPAPTKQQPLLLFHVHAPVRLQDAARKLFARTQASISPHARKQQPVETTTAKPTNRPYTHAALHQQCAPV